MRATDNDQVTTRAATSGGPSSPRSPSGRPRKLIKEADRAVNSRLTFINRAIRPGDQEGRTA